MKKGNEKYIKISLAKHKTTAKTVAQQKVIQKVEGWRIRCRSNLKMQSREGKTFLTVGRASLSCQCSTIPFGQFFKVRLRPNYLINRWQQCFKVLDLLVFAPTMKTHDKFFVFLVFHCQQQFPWLVWLFVPQMLDINLTQNKHLSEQETSSN